MDVDVITVSQKLGLQIVLNTWIESVFYFCFFFLLFALCDVRERGYPLYGPVLEYDNPTTCC